MDGVSYFQRVLASNLDPNREHLKLDRQQSRDIKQVFSDYNPHLAIDLHEFTAPTVYGGDYQHGNDAYVGIRLIHVVYTDIVSTDSSLEEYIPIHVQAFATTSTTS